METFLEIVVEFIAGVILASTTDEVICQVSDGKIQDKEFKFRVKFTNNSSKYSILKIPINAEIKNSTVSYDSGSIQNLFFQDVNDRDNIPENLVAHIIKIKPNTSKRLTFKVYNSNSNLFEFDYTYKHRNSKYYFNRQKVRF